MSSRFDNLKMVSDLRALDQTSTVPFRSVVIVRKCEARTARNGNTYLMLELGDASGSFNYTCFDDKPHYRFCENLEQGTVVLVDGRTGYFNNRLSPDLELIEPVSDEDLKAFDLEARLVAGPVEDADVLWQQLVDVVDSIERPSLRAAVQYVLDRHGDAFRTTPGAIAMHHAYRSGLLEHTVRMTRCCERLLPLYPMVDGDLAKAGIILHDIGKIDEYTGAMAPGKTRLGILQGHVVLGYRIVRKAALVAGVDKLLVERLEHIILSHQGALEWGAAALAATPEAVFVSMIDNLDAKMGSVETALLRTPEGRSFSEFIPALGTQLLTDPLPGEPEAEEEPKPDDDTYSESDSEAGEPGAE